MSFYKQYTTPPNRAAFAGLAKLRKIFPDVSENELRKRLQSIDAYSRHKEAKRVKKYNPFIVRVRLEVLQLDLLDVRQLAEANQGVTYIFMIIDTFSRKAWGIPLKNKQGPTVKDAFLSFVKREFSTGEAKNIRRILCDRGAEFAGKEFKSLLVRLRIKMTHPNAHAPHVERLNRTIQKILYSYMTEKQTVQYLRILPDIFKTYNTRIHSAHGLAPEDAFKKENSFRVNAALEKKLADRLGKETPRFKVGDMVRVRNPAKAFARSYKDTHSIQIFKIAAIKNSPLPAAMYELVNLRGTPVAGFFYANQLAKIIPKPSMFRIDKILGHRTRPNGREEVLVRWLDYPKSFDSWISRETIEESYL